MVVGAVTEVVVAIATLAWVSETGNSGVTALTSVVVGACVIVLEVLGTGVP
jgi:hypothetical protein